MKRVLLLGYYGYGNAGDEWLLANCRRLLAKTHPNVIVTVLHPHGDHDQHYYNRRSFLAVTIGIIRADVVMVGGGGIFQDRTSFGSLLYYVSLIILARMFLKKVVMLSQGLSPFRYGVSRNMVRFCFKKAALITVRDAESKAMLVQMGLPEAKISETGDLAFYRADLPDIGQDLRESSSLALSLRTFHFPPGLEARLSAFLVGLNKPFLFLDFQHPSDRLALGRFGSVSERVKHVLTMEHFIQPLRPLPEPCQLLIAMRYHACVWAALNGLPFLALSYDDKVKTLAEQLGQPVVDLTKGIPTEAAFEDAYRTLKQGYEAFRNRLLDGVKVRIALAKRHEDLLAELA